MKTIIQDVDESEIFGNSEHFSNLEFDWKNKIFDDSVFKDSIFNEIGYYSSVMTHDGSGGGGVPEYSRSNSMESSSSSVSDTSFASSVPPPTRDSDSVTLTPTPDSDSLTPPNERYGTTRIIMVLNINIQPRR